MAKDEEDFPAPLNLVLTPCLAKRGPYEDGFGNLVLRVNKDEALNIASELLFGFTGHGKEGTIEVEIPLELSDKDRARHAVDLLLSPPVVDLTEENGETYVEAEKELKKKSVRQLAEILLRSVTEWPPNNRIASNGRRRVP